MKVLYVFCIYSTVYVAGSAALVASGVSKRLKSSGKFKMAEFTSRAPSLSPLQASNFGKLLWLLHFPSQEEDE